MNIVYPDNLQDLDAGRFLCITKKGDLAVVDLSVFTTGIKPVVGEVVYFSYEIQSPDFKRLDGSLFKIADYPDAAATLAGVYDLGDEPKGFMRLPNMEKGQLFARQCSTNLPLGKVSRDTFKKHKHKYETGAIGNDWNQGGGSGPWIGARKEPLTTTGMSVSGKFNETAMKNVVMIPYLRMRP